MFYGGRPGHAVGRSKVREYFDSYVGTLAAARLSLVDQELRKLGEGLYLAQGLLNPAYPTSSDLKPPR